MRRLLVPIIAATALLAAGVATVGVAPATASGTPCWKQLLNDYLPDQRIDKTYQLSCYNQALAHLHEDVVDYGSAVTDIKRALASAILAYKVKHGGGPPGPNSFLSPPGGNLQKGRHNDGLLRRLANALGPGNASSIPLPLLILAGLGLLLVTLAAASYTARRIQARRRMQARPQPATSPPTPPRRR